MCEPGLNWWPTCARGGWRVRTSYQASATRDYRQRGCCGVPYRRPSEGGGGRAPARDHSSPELCRCSCRDIHFPVFNHIDGNPPCGEASRKLTRMPLTVIVIIDKDRNAIGIRRHCIGKRW